MAKNAAAAKKPASSRLLRNKESKEGTGADAGTA